MQIYEHTQLGIVQDWLRECPLWRFHGTVDSCFLFLIIFDGFISCYIFLSNAQLKNLNGIFIDKILIIVEVSNFQFEWIYIIQCTSNSYITFPQKIQFTDSIFSLLKCVECNVWDRMHPNCGSTRKIVGKILGQLKLESWFWIIS